MIGLLCAVVLYSSCATMNSYGVQGRRAYRQEYRQNFDNNRLMQQQYKEQRRIHKEAKRANKQRKYDTNQHGNIIDKL
jgi:hypothetical protein